MPLDRRRFLETAGALCFTLPTGLRASSGLGKVLVIGAGPAGMAAGHLLRQAGADYQIIEAAPTHGGRIKQTKTFVNFPISLGGEWLHASPKQLALIINDPKVKIATKTKGYSAKEPAGWFADGEYSTYPTGSTADRKFVGSSWLDFYDAYIVPGIRDRITFNTPAVSVDYRKKTVVVTDRAGKKHEADRVIVTVPLKVLQRGDLAFKPALPQRRQKTIAKAVVWGGFKAFIAFKKSFYPSTLAFPDSETRAGQRIYYDAAYGQKSKAAVLGLFAVGKQAEPYQRLAGQAQRDHMLAELDRVFDGAATRYYRKHIVQDWNQEPFIHAAYLADNNPSHISQELSGSIDKKIYFAGEAYTRFDDWGAVHNAARSARDAVREILGR